VAGGSLAQSSNLRLRYKATVAVVALRVNLALAIPSPERVDAHAKGRGCLSEREVTWHLNADGTGLLEGRVVRVAPVGTYALPRQ
jgi:hypothetical protein